MQRLLKSALGQFTRPKRASTDLSTFTYEQVTRSDGIAIVFVWRNVHCGKVFDVDSVPLDIGIPKIGERVVTRNSLGVEHLAEALRVSVA